METIRLQTPLGTFNVTDTHWGVVAPKERFMLRAGIWVMKVYQTIRSVLSGFKIDLQSIGVDLDPRIHLEDIRPGMSLEAQRLAVRSIVTALGANSNYQVVQYEPTSIVARVKRFFRASNRRKERYI